MRFRAPLQQSRIGTAACIGETDNVVRSAIGIWNRIIPPTKRGGALNDSQWQIGGFHPPAQCQFLPMQHRNFRRHHGPEIMTGAMTVDVMRPDVPDTGMNSGRAVVELGQNNNAATGNGAGTALAELVPVKCGPVDGRNGRAANAAIPVQRRHNELLVRHAAGGWC
jgi:hypothetical protein